MLFHKNVQPIKLTIQVLNKLYSFYDEACLVFVLKSTVKVLFFLKPYILTRVYREHFIYAKYERKEFAQPDTSLYECDVKEGIMYKRGKKDKNFRPRTFVLDTKEGVLKYFVKDVRILIILKLILTAKITK